MQLKELLWSFKGRIPRSKYWYYFLAYLGISLVATFIDIAIFGRDNQTRVFTGLVGLVAIIPSLAVSVKRAHDRNHSGWFLLVGLIPLIGWLWVLIEFGFLRGTVGENKYGPDPVTAAAA